MGKYSVWLSYANFIKTTFKHKETLQYFVNNPFFSFFLFLVTETQRKFTNVLAKKNIQLNLLKEKERLKDNSCAICSKGKLNMKPRDIHGMIISAMFYTYRQTNKQVNACMHNIERRKTWISWIHYFRREMKACTGQTLHCVVVVNKDYI